MRLLRGRLDFRLRKQICAGHVRSHEPSPMDSSLLCRVNMPAVVIALGGLMTIESDPADAAHYRAWNFAVQLLATSPLGAHFCTSFAIPAGTPQRRLGDLGQEGFPVRLEASAGLVERSRRPEAVLSWRQTWIEAAVPMPLVDVDGGPGALADRSDADIVIEDVPGHLVRLSERRRVRSGVTSSCLRIIGCVWRPAVLNFILLIVGSR
jgi:hypothetical protein